MVALDDRLPPRWMISKALNLQAFPPPFRVQLQVGARWRAACHIVRNWRSLHRHRIWRHYRLLGLQTFLIGCSCGKRFDRSRHRNYPSPAPLSRYYPQTKGLPNDEN